MEAASGNLRAVAAAPIAATVRTISGDVEIDAPRTERTSITTVSGDVEIASTFAPGGDHVVTTTSGDVELAVHGGVTIDVRTVSGDVDCAHPELRGGKGRRDPLVIGDGAARLAVRTLSGDIEVRAGRVRPEWVAVPGSPAQGVQLLPAVPPLPVVPPVAGVVDARAGDRWNHRERRNCGEQLHALGRRARDRDPLRADPASADLDVPGERPDRESCSTVADDERIPPSLATAQLGMRAVDVARDGPNVDRDPAVHRKLHVAGRRGHDVVAARREGAGDLHVAAHGRDAGPLGPRRVDLHVTPDRGNGLGERKRIVAADHP